MTMKKQYMRSEISPWMIVLAIFIAFLLMCIPAGAQSTTVSATVVDQSSTIWANGSWKVQLVPNPNAGGNIFWNGNPLPNTQWTYQGALDGSGAFSQSVPSNAFITPAGSTYTLTICPNATSQCSTIVRTTIQGTSLDLSSLITNNTPAPTVKPISISRAYNDNEVSVTPSMVGYMYQNVTENKPRYWNGTIWSDFVASIESFAIGNLPPLFTTQTGIDPNNPDVTFQLDNAAANTVFGNCTTGTAAPSYCSLTAAMIPSLPYVPASTTFFYQTMDANATAQTQRAALNFSSFFTLSDSASPSRTTVDPVHTITAGSCAFPSTISYDVYGRITACSAGTQPSTKIVRTASAIGCVTPTGTGQACDQTITWSDGGFADTNYAVSCSGQSPFTSGSSSEPFAVDLTGWGTPTTTTVNVQTTSKGSDTGASFGTVTCIGVHN